MSKYAETLVLLRKLADDHFAKHAAANGDAYLVGFVTGLAAAEMYGPELRRAVELGYAELTGMPAEQIETILRHAVEP